MPITRSKNATIAKNGFEAEKSIVLQEDVKETMETYFQSPIIRITRVHGKKYDLLLTFENGTKRLYKTKMDVGKDADGLWIGGHWTNLKMKRLSSYLHPYVS